MQNQLAADLAQFDQVLDLARQYAVDYLQELPNRPAGVVQPPRGNELPALTDTGPGAAAALEGFRRRYGHRISGSPGARYFGFVTGGGTPAALAADWLVSTYDQNAQREGATCAADVELEALAWLRELMGLPAEFAGCFVSGATMANTVGLALGRQWLGRRAGIDIAAEGLYRIPPIQVLSTTIHSSSRKGMAMLGMGRNTHQPVPALAGREAIDAAALEAKLREAAGHNLPTIVVANAGTVNTVDFDDLRAVADLRQKYPFWLHVDAAFGGVAAASMQYRGLLAGWEAADSITVDAHKWLNVPYDSAMVFTRHLDLQVEVFQNHAPYLGNPDVSPDNFLHLTPENSRRWRALPVWMTLAAYGRSGVAEVVERNVASARYLGELIGADPRFTLLAPVRLNVVCFTLAGAGAADHNDRVRQYLQRVNAEGTAFFTGTRYDGAAGIRAALVNWRTTAADIDATWAALQRCLADGGIAG